MNNPVVKIDYTNHLGERSAHRIIPVTLVFEKTLWHPGEQWILYAYDLDKQATRSFAMKNVHKWEPINEPT